MLRFHEDTALPTTIASIFAPRFERHGFCYIAPASKTPFTADLWKNDVLEMGITVGSDPEMLPRSAIRSVPYAPAI